MLNVRDLLELAHQKGISLHMVNLTAYKGVANLRHRKLNDVSAIVH